MKVAPSVVGEIIQIPRKRIRPFAEQPRTFFDPIALRLLAESIKAIGQQTPVVVRRINGDSRHDYELIDGQRRWFACELIGKDEMLAWVRDVKDIDEQYEMSFAANFGREEHTPLETARALDRLMKKSDKGTAAVAKLCAKSVTWVQNYLVILKLVPEVQNLLEPTLPEAERLKISVATQTALHTLPPAKQLETAKAVIARKLSFKEATRFIDGNVNELGIVRKARGRPRQPRDEFNMFAGFVRRTIRDANFFLETPDSHWQWILRTRSPAEVAQLRVELNEAIEELQGIRQGLERFEGVSANGNSQAHTR